MSASLTASAVTYSPSTRLRLRTSIFRAFRGPTSATVLMVSPSMPTGLSLLLLLMLLLLRIRVLPGLRPHLTKRSSVSRIGMPTVAAGRIEAPTLWEWGRYSGAGVLCVRLRGIVPLLMRESSAMQGFPKPVISCIKRRLLLGIVDCQADRRPHQIQ